MRVLSSRKRVIGRNSRPSRRKKSLLPIGCILQIVVYSFAMRSVSSLPTSLRRLGTSSPASQAGATIKPFSMYHKEASRYARNAFYVLMCEYETVYIGCAAVVIFDEQHDMACAVPVPFACFCDALHIRHAVYGSSDSSSKSIRSNIACVSSAI